VIREPDIVSVAGSRESAKCVTKESPSAIIRIGPFKESKFYDGAFRNHISIHVGNDAIFGSYRLIYNES
jgi:hypothetical protein